MCTVRLDSLPSVSSISLKRDDTEPSSKMFDSRMFYTAISRTRKLEQIYKVENELPKFEFNGEIYKMVCHKQTYIGSTIQSLENRFKGHENAYHQYKKR